MADEAADIKDQDQDQDQDQDPDAPVNVRQLSKKLRTLFRYGEDAFDKNNYGYAIEMYRRVLRSQPACHEVRTKLHEAQVKKTGGKPNALVSFWAWTVSQVMDMYNQAALLRKEKYSEAIDLGEYCLTLDPTCPAAAMVVAKAAEDAGVYTAGILALESSQKYNPKDISILAELGALYEFVGRGRDCLITYQKCKSIQPKVSKWEKKVSEAAALASMERDHWTDIEKGEGDYRTVMKSSNEAAQLEHEGRTQATEQGRQVLIDAQIKKLETNDTIGGRRRLAELYAADRQWDLSLQWYESSHELAGTEDPTVVQTMIEIRCYKIDDQITELEQTAGNEEQVAQLQQDRVAFRLNGYQESLRKFPSNHAVRFEYAKLMAEQGRHDEALPEFQKVQGNPQFRDEASMFVGTCFMTKGVYDLAVDQFKSVIDNIYHMDETKKGAYWQLAQCYEAMGSDDEAKSCYKEIYQVDVNFRDGEVRQKIEGG